MNFTPQQKYSLLSKMGYNGPVNDNQMENFMQSNPGAAAKMGKFDRAMKRGFQEGGLISGNVSSSTKIEAARKEYSQAMARLARAEQIKNGWSISGIETKTPPTTTPTTPQATTPTTPQATTPTTPQATTPTTPQATPKSTGSGLAVPGYTVPPAPRQGQSKGGIV